MGKITKTQLENINNRCRNDWRFDVQYFMYHSEKTLIKQISFNIINLNKEKDIRKAGMII